MSSADQAYLNTRVSMMSLRLLAPEAIGPIARMPLPALAERFGLGALLDEPSSITTRRRVLEQGLTQVLLAEMQLLMRPMSAAHRQLVLAWGRKFALYNLKTLLRGKLYALDQKEIREHLFDLPDFMRLPSELFRAENVLELLRQLEAGPYRQIARQAREVYEQQREPFALEAAVDQRYYAEIVHQIMGFDVNHLDSLRRLLGAELDRVALLWLLRFRFSYHLSPSETYYRLVPSMRLLTRERLLNLVNLESLRQVIDALPEPLNALLAKCETIAEVQPHLVSHTQGELRWILHQSQSAVARALAYLMLRESDLMLLFAVAQGRLLQFPERTIEVALDLIEAHPARADARAA
ncbi:V0D/AC39 family V-type ATPase subunit [Thiocystis violacea]|uniref:V0D/AC39 family V-type ATPase subunit n=1 Tax=Thiocystis violacea TaxID=13725 RepID=UPI001903332D|nr:V-type ATPase subunit [Thiocystis violacea]MBK1719625.1 ATPase [Thiocystis violacea]